jgi:hypothetical protein
MQSNEYVEGESDQTVLLDDERVCRWRSQGGSASVKRVVGGVVCWTNGRCGDNLHERNRTDWQLPLSTPDEILWRVRLRLLLSRGMPVCDWRDSRD